MINQINNNLPKEWRKVKLGEVAGVLGGFAFKSSWFNKQRIGYPVIKIQNLGQDGFIDTQNIEYVDIDLVNKNISKFKVGYNDFFVAMTGATAGKIAVLKDKNKDYYLNQRVGKFYIKDKNKLDFKYFYYSIFMPKNKIVLRQLADGSAQGNMSTGQIEELLEINLPPLDEQKWIADILSAFDDKIELNNKIIKTLEEMAQEVFKEWFIKFNFPVEFEVKNEKLKVKSVGYKDAGGKFVDSELGKIPEGWEVKKIGDILSLEYGKALTAPNRKTGNIPVYASSGIVGYHNEKLDNGPGIIVGRAGIPGSVYWSQTDFYCVDSAFYIKTTISKYFVYYLLKYQNLESLVSGSAVPGLNRNMVYLNLAVLPNIEIINKFEDFIKPAFLKIYNLKVENQTLATLRDLLLPKLMSGEILVNSE